MVGASDVGVGVGVGVWEAVEDGPSWLIDPAQLKIMWRLRRLFTGLEQQQALELVLGKLKDTQSNAEFLMVISKTTPAGTSLADSEE